MPRIEDEILPLYEDQGLVVVPVHVGLDASTGVAQVVDLGVTLPIALDLEGEVFRHYRVRQAVFPLNVVVNRDGVLVHVDTELDLDATQAAIVAALAE